MKKYKCSVLLLFFLTILSPPLIAKPANFEEAKIAAKIIWNEHRETFYCGCKYSKYGIIDYNSCEYKPIDKRKARRIGWEHVVPASWYGHKLDCWHNKNCASKSGKILKGRNCCRSISPQFREMEADLYNLVPVIREVNVARANYRFAEFARDTDNTQRYNGCNLIIHPDDRVVEPQDKVKGMIARIHFYMSRKYGIELSKQDKETFTKWDQQYPVSSWEKRWEVRVKEFQGE